MPLPASARDYPDDIFADTRMSFGDHLEELRSRLLKALYGLVIILFGGLVLDYVGKAAGWKYVGVGRPMLQVIVAPAEEQGRAFYARRNERTRYKLDFPPAAPAEIERVVAKWDANDRDNDALTADELVVLRGAPAEMPVLIPTAAFEEAFGIKAKNPAVKEVEVKLKVYPTWLNYLSSRGETLLENRQYMKTQSVQESMVVYFKVALLCSAVIGSPWIFYQMWAFVAAGLYPHERAHVRRMLLPSVGLFLAGVLLCQFVVLPGAAKALLAFNDWVELDPDLRLNEWLGFALILPLVFGVSFQTPLVMFFLNRLGTFTAADYLSKWRYAVIVLAALSAVITPSPDAVTMLYLFVPMFGLYLVGIAVCHVFPPAHEEAWNESEEQVAV